MASNLHSHLGTAIAHLRQKRELSQEALAERAHISLSTLTKIERGAIKAPSVFTVLDIARTLDVSLDELLGSAHPELIQNDQGVRFIYFDIHGVMATNWERVFTELAKRYDIQPQEIEMVFWRYNDIVGRGHMSLDDFEVALAQNLRLDIERIDYRGAYFAAIKAQPEVHTLMQDLSAHYEIGLLSNIFPGFMDRLLKLGVIPALPYTARVESCEIGSVKPEAAIYSYAASLTQTTPEHILLIDDTHANIDVAKKLGWQGFWFDEQHSGATVNSLRSLLLPQ